MASGNDDKIDKTNNKASVIPRFLAYVLDYAFVVIVASLISMPFIDSKSTTYISNEMISLIQKYSEKEINENEYLVQFSNIQYKAARNMEIYSIFLVLVNSLYFIVLPLYNNGQTMGKKLMKMKIVSIDKELSANQLIFRSFIANGIFFNIVSILLLMFASRNVYLSLNGELDFIGFIIMCISFCLIIITKQGLSIHDMLAHTKVINCKE